VRLALRNSSWIGLGRGHGHLIGQRVRVDLYRGSTPPQSIDLWLPDTDREVREAGARVMAIDQVKAG
jgi:hypothetical protein